MRSALAGLVISPAARASALVVALLAVAALAATAVASIKIFYTGHTPTALPSGLEATCLGASEGCRIQYQDLGFGRHGLAIQGIVSSGAAIRLVLEDEPPAAGVHLVLRIGGEAYASKGGVSRSRVLVHDGSGERLGEAIAEAGESQWPGPRLVLALDSPARPRELDIQLVPTEPLEEPTTLTIGEVGLFPDDPAVLDRLIPGGPDPCQVWPRRVFVAAIVAMLLALPLLGDRQRLVLGALFVLLLALALFFVVLNGYYSPFWQLDARGASAIAARAPHYLNLTVGIKMAWHVLEGKGPLQTASSPPFHRMPGYAYLLALGGLFAAGDPFALVLSVFTTQALFNAVALTLFFVSLARYTTPLKALPICVLVAALPNQIQHTQLDTIIVGAYLLTAAAGLTLLRALEREGRASVFHYLGLHGSFALWLSLRPDVLPGWAALSLLLHRRKGRRRYLALPILLAAAVCIPWGLFKMRFTGEFAPTTSSIGWSMAGALGEVPNRFGWVASDSYIRQWLTAEGFDPFTSKAASDFAGGQTVRCWFTFPGYTASLVWHNLNLYFHTTGLPGTDPRLFDWSFLGLDHSQLVRSGNLHIVLGPLVTLVLLSLALRFRTRQTLLLGWAFFFNLPIFFVLYSSAGRFFSGATASLLVSAAVLALDRELYRAVWRRPLLSGAVIALVLAFLIHGPRVDALLLSWDQFRYATPFFGPETCTLTSFEPPS